MGWAGLGGLGGLGWAGLGWAGLGWAGLGWAGLGCWAGLGWAGLGWAGLGWAGLGWLGGLGGLGPGLGLGWAGLGMAGNGLFRVQALGFEGLGFGVCLRTLKVSGTTVAGTLIASCTVNHGSQVSFNEFCVHDPLRSPLVLLLLTIRGNRNSYLVQYKHSCQQPPCDPQSS